MKSVPTMDWLPPFNGKQPEAVMRPAVPERQRDSARLAVITTRGRGLLDNIRIRLEMQRMIRSEARPILIAQAGRRLAYERILVAADLSSAAAAAACVALEMWPNAQVVFLHAFEARGENATLHAQNGESLFSSRALAREAAREKLNGFADGICHAHTRVSRVVHHGKPLAVIGNYAARMKTDLIVVGARPASSPLAYFSKCAAHRLAEATSCDVLLATA
ncbi:universal stress protein [Noviherbaspirillum malthae]|uniref:universal stress protein n=1 Tax=Noviherbaspirillum malthae TaxID=1260987 RepID=UPI00188EC517|nr:universal stress protein [Noviherbaspirillum malthae]